MRICHVIEATAGGSARIAAQLAKGQIAVGHEVTMVYSPLRADRLFREAVNATDGLTKIEIPMQRSVGIHDIKTFFKLISFFFKAGSFDIIHSHSSKAGALSRLIGLLQRNSVQIYSPHAFYSMAANCSKVYYWIEYIFSWFTDAIITVSPLEKEHAIRELGISEKKIHVIVNGVETSWHMDREQARQLLSLSPQNYVIGFVGRLVEQKNIFRLIEAFSLIIPKITNAVLVIVGDGELKGALENEINTQNLGNKVTIFSGYDGRDAMPAFDCLICSSDYESFGLVILEALVANVPVVTTAVGIAEIAIINAKNGYVTSFSAREIAERVVELALLKPAERITMMRDARSIIEKFDVKNMVAETLKLYVTVRDKR